jgi:hypothetical protein
MRRFLIFFWMSLSYFIRPKTLLQFRSCALIFSLIFSIYEIYYDPGYYFWYLTNWNWIFLIGYFMVASLQSYFNLIDQEKPRPKIYKTHAILFSIVQTLPYPVSVAYWIFLFKPVLNDPDISFWLKAQGVVNHSLNIVLPLCDLFLSKTSMGWLYIIYPNFVMLFYEIVVNFVHIIFKVKFPYSFLEMFMGSKDSVIWINLGLYILGMALFICFAFTIIVLVINLRNFFGAKREIDVLPINQK